MSEDGSYSRMSKDFKTERLQKLLHVNSKSAMSEEQQPTSSEDLQQGGGGGFFSCFFQVLCCCCVDNKPQPSQTPDQKLLQQQQSESDLWTSSDFPAAAQKKATTRRKPSSFIEANEAANKSLRSGSDETPSLRHSLRSARSAVEQTAEVVIDFYLLEELANKSNSNVFIFVRQTTLRSVSRSSSSQDKFPPELLNDLALRLENSLIIHPACCSSLQSATVFKISELASALVIVDRSKSNLESLRKAGSSQPSSAHQTRIEFIQGELFYLHSIQSDVVVLSLVSKERPTRSIGGKLSLLTDFNVDVEEILGLSLDIAHTIILILPRNTDLSVLAQLLLQLTDENRSVMEVFKDTEAAEIIVIFGKLCEVSEEEEMQYCVNRLVSVEGHLKEKIVGLVRALSKATGVRSVSSLIKISEKVVNARYPRDRTVLEEFIGRLAADDKLTMKTSNSHLTKQVFIHLDAVREVGGFTDRSYTQSTRMSPINTSLDAGNSSYGGSGGGNSHIVTLKRKQSTNSTQGGALSAAAAAAAQTQRPNRSQLQSGYSASFQLSPQSNIQMKHSYSVLSDPSLAHNHIGGGGGGYPTTTNQSAEDNEDDSDEEKTHPLVFSCSYSANTLVGSEMSEAQSLNPQIGTNLLGDERCQQFSCEDFNMYFNMEKQNQQVLQQRKEHEKEKGDIILNAIKDDDDYDDS